ncbi:uncharacterized protein LOC143078595 [Mytilus galloprovincialis]|uniref:uncharacterized protein LOC143078595 n=1 Tax=Mytilus galloprovincialis TaxID=29158 RepID=UPI003F7CC237
MAQNSSESITTIDHGLAQYPVKVDVQVKVHVDGEDHIFSGIGSAHRDDDYPYPYGGVVYKYNDVHIKLATPYDTKLYSHSDSGGIAYTVTENFKEVHHGLEYYPDSVSVQTKMSDGYISDGQVIEE